MPGIKRFCFSLLLGTLFSELFFQLRGRRVRCIGDENVKNKPMIRAQKEMRREKEESIFRWAKSLSDETTPLYLVAIDWLNYTFNNSCNRRNIISIRIPNKIVELIPIPNPILRLIARPVRPKDPWRSAESLCNGTRASLSVEGASD